MDTGLITQALRTLKGLQKRRLMLPLIIFSGLRRNTAIWNSLSFFKVLRHLFSIKIQQVLYVMIEVKWWAGGEIEFLTVLPRSTFIFIIP